MPRLGSEPLNLTDKCQCDEPDISIQPALGNNVQNKRVNHDIRAAAGETNPSELAAIKNSECCDVDARHCKSDARGAEVEVRKTGKWHQRLSILSYINAREATRCMRGLLTFCAQRGQMNRAVRRTLQTSISFAQ